MSALQMTNGFPLSPMNLSATLNFTGGRPDYAIPGRLHSIGPDRTQHTEAGVAFFTP